MTLLLLLLRSSFVLFGRNKKVSDGTTCVDCVVSSKKKNQDVCLSGFLWTKQHTYCV